MTYARKRYHQSYSSPLSRYAFQRQALVVLIEPDEAIRSLLQDVLWLQGYRVHVAAPGISAAAVAQLRPQGVIVDFGPVLSRCSLTFLHDLRLLLADLDVAVLVTTTSTWIDATNAGYLRRLSCEVLYQPFELQSLLDWSEQRLPPVAAHLARW